MHLQPLRSIESMEIFFLNNSMALGNLEDRHVSHK